MKKGRWLLFTTPTSQGAILGGKFTTVFLTLSVQIGVLLGGSALVFGIDWGRPLTVVLMWLGLIIVAAGFGVLLMSFLKSTRQTGPVMGGVLTITGMLGGLFTTGIPNLPDALDTVSRTMPQGWTLYGWQLSLDGAAPGDVFTTFLVMIGMGFAFLGLGVALFHRRFE
jgi:ABC-2 type transport system permease protein